MVSVEIMSNSYIEKPTTQKERKKDDENLIDPGHGYTAPSVSR